MPKYKCKVIIYNNEFEKDSEFENAECAIPAIRNLLIDIYDGDICRLNNDLSKFFNDKYEYGYCDFEVSIINLDYKKPSQSRIDFVNEYIHDCEAKLISINKHVIKDLCVSEIYTVEFKSLSEYYIERYEELFDAYGSDPVRRDLNDYDGTFKFKEGDIVTFLKFPDKEFSVGKIPYCRVNGPTWTLTYDLYEADGNMEIYNVHQSYLSIKKGSD